ncbi:MAG: hypothetical protein JXD23_14475 [Spirochaetales bacterium]|nr:hypothetical protein [Spirochaetales bacterium]
MLTILVVALVTAVSLLVYLVFFIFGDAGRNTASERRDGRRVPPANR